MSDTSNSKEKLWEQRIQKWKASGLSQKRWCEDNGVAPSSFHYWLSKKQNQQLSAKGFTELTDRAIAALGSGLVIRLGSLVIQLDKDFDELTLHRLLRSLEGLS